MAVGTFPSEHRAGVDTFWAQAEAAGLVWEEQPVTDEAGRPLPEAAADSRWGRLYVFRAAAHARPRERWGEEDEQGVGGLAPLFDEDEDEEQEISRRLEQEQGTVGAAVDRLRRAQPPEEMRQRA